MLYPPTCHLVMSSCRWPRLLCRCVVASIDHVHSVEFFMLSVNFAVSTSAPRNVCRTVSVLSAEYYAFDDRRLYSLSFLSFSTYYSVYFEKKHGNITLTFYLREYWVTDNKQLCSLSALFCFSLSSFGHTFEYV